MWFSTTVLFVCLLDSFHLHFDRKDDNLESRGSINYQFSRMYGGIDKYGGDIVCQKQKEDVDVQWGEIVLYEE